MAALDRKWAKLQRKLKKLRLRPISVFLFHQVSDEFDETTMYSCDWTETNQFKHNIEELKKKYRFISLEKAFAMMRRDMFRFHDYAVLTSDDGWASLKNVLPWLSEQSVPVTLFLNPGYFDGTHYRDKDTEKYLLADDLNYICGHYSNVSIGSHGWEHTDAKAKTESDFREDIKETTEVLKQYPCFVPFHAYTWGKYNDKTQAILKEFDIVPVFIDNEKNTDDITCVHRELLDGMKL